VRICVIDGQGGGIGVALIRRLKELYREEHEVVALGTNEVATAQMIKARANRGASGENAIIWTVPRVDVILGSISIIIANAMMGELTPRMAEAIASAPAPKILLPLTREGVEIVGIAPEPLPHLVDRLMTRNLKEFFKNV
jgi:NAD(P)-dependent dehydrogenase (short-subunit alcohol dehydrogenase family)